MIDKFSSIFSRFCKSVPFIDSYLINYKSKSIRIVYFHLISDEKHNYYFPQKGISISQFKSHLQFLKKNFNIISFSSLEEKIKNNDVINKDLLITFDDGFKENASIIAPILIDLNIPASFFFISNCVDNKDLMWRNKLLIIFKYLDEDKFNVFLKKHSLNKKIIIKNIKLFLSTSLNYLDMNQKEFFVNNLWKNFVPFSIEEFLNENNPYCSSEDIRNLSNEGFEIGSHSVSHPVFSKLSYDIFKEEILLSSGFLEKIIQKKINLFSYPFGIRANKKFEDLLLKEGTNIKYFLGIKNVLKNNKNNFQSWERDNLEFDNERMYFRLLILPIIRRFIHNS